MTLQPISSGMTITQQARFTPASGDTITIPNVDGDVQVILAPTVAIASLILNWPSMPYPGQTVTVVSTQNIASITHTGNTLNANINGLKSTGGFSFMWDPTAATYMCSEFNAPNAVYGFPSNSAGIIASASVDAKTVASTPIYTNSTAKTLIVTNLIVRCAAATAISVGPALGMGTSAGINDIFSSTAVLALTTANNVFGFALYGMSSVIPAGGTMFLNLATAATGTAQTIAADIMGYFVS